MTSNLTPLHVVRDALPLESGYTLRSHQIARAQRAEGMNSSVVSAPVKGRVRADKTFRDGIGVRNFDGVPYYRADEPNWLRRWSILLAQYLHQRGIPLVEGFGPSFQPDANGWDHLMTAVVNHAPRIDLVHAHTPFVTARHGLQLARQLEIPFVCEVRGFWEATAESQGKSVMEELGYSLSAYAQADAKIAQDADAVITLGEAMRDELIDRGVEADKVFVSPNCIDVDRFQAIANKDARLCNDLALADSFVIGYVTSVRRLEGIDCLLKALKLLREDTVPAKVVIVGGGNYLPDLRKIATDLEIEEHVHFVGRVPHEDIQRYYSVLDVFVVPRSDFQVCRLVTPLKPLEAMALEIPVVVSDLPALREIVRPDDTGMIFQPGDPQDLSRVLCDLFHNPDLRRQLKKNARQWVMQNRTWAVVAEKTAAVYAKLVA